eukprot:EG_transcript_11823
MRTADPVRTFALPTRSSSSTSTDSPPTLGLLQQPPTLGLHQQPPTAVPRSPPLPSTPTQLSLQTPSPSPSPPSVSLPVSVTNATLCAALDAELTERRCFKTSDPAVVARCHALHTQCYLHQPSREDIEQLYPLEVKEIRNCHFAFRGPRLKFLHATKLLCTPVYPVKFFAESRLSDHLDARWGLAPLPAGAARQALFRALFLAWANFTDERGLRYWLHAGSLLGWFFNKAMLPWDDDLDVQVLATDLLSPERYHKHDRTFYRFRYFFEINPNSAQRAPDRRNIIDARFIDRLSGIFIDIVAVSYNPPRNALQCKQGQQFDPSHVFPIRRTTFEGVPTWIPYKASQFLIAKYSINATRRHQPQQHPTTRCPRTGPCTMYFFNTTTDRWVNLSANLSASPLPAQ